jgi:hypothetical protein
MLNGCKYKYNTRIISQPDKEFSFFSLGERYGNMPWKR